MRNVRLLSAAGGIALATSISLGNIRPAAAQGAQPALPSSPAERNVPPSSTTPATPEQKPQGLTFDDSGGNIRLGDFTWTFWGYGERIFNPGKGTADYWRRFRQGSEIDFPRITTNLRPAIVYEVDLTDSNFLANGVGNRRGLGRRNFENFYFAIQDAEDSTQFRALIGENTHIFSREDNLSSGNLPTVNRSLILEEHNGAGIFGSQFGVEYGMALSSQYSIAFAALDNRGSLNQDRPQYSIGNSFSARLSATPLDEKEQGRKLTWGIAVDHTRNFRDRTFPLLTATLQNQIGGVPANGNKFSVGADVAYTFPALFGRPATIEAEGIYSRFGASRTDVAGGYVMLQHQVFDSGPSGDLDLFARQDAVALKTASVSGQVVQQATRLGVNYNLPYAQRRANFHLEYAHNRATGTAAILQSRGSDEFILALRFSLQPYIRH